MNNHETNISIFLPTRSGSERVKNKNTRRFASFEGGLLELKLNQLLKVDNIDKIILSTNEDNSIKIGEKYQKKASNLILDKRPEHLSRNDTDLVDLIKYVPTLTETDHILWTHVTSPFYTSEQYDSAIEKYFSVLGKGFDSLMSVTSFKNFLWDKEEQRVINRLTEQKWPKTQDLMDLYEVDSGIFINSRNNYINHADRIGSNPFLYVVDKITSFDIDWEDDFIIAEAIQEKLFNKQYT